jgi:hypothetical protein
VSSDEDDEENSKEMQDKINGDSLLDAIFFDKRDL